MPSNPDFTGIDCPSDASGQIDCLKKKGVTFIVRYISHNTHNFPDKRMTVKEAKALSKAGFSLATCWEDLPANDTAKPSHFTHAFGVAEGQAAYTYAKSTLGQPANSGIYFAVDFDSSAQQDKTIIADYFKGVLDGFKKVDGKPIYRIGIYGSGATCKFLFSEGLTQLSWVALSQGFRGTKGFKDFHIKQLKEQRICGLDADTDISNNADFGQFKV